jgi:hypothetical protein
VKGTYEVGFSEYGQLLLKEQKGSVFGKKRSLQFTLDQSFKMILNFQLPVIMHLMMSEYDFKPHRH